MRFVPGYLGCINENNLEWPLRERVKCVLSAMLEEIPRRGGSFCRVGQLTPGNKLDVLLPEQCFELRTGEEVKIALAPGCAPGIALARGGAHLFVVKCQMDNEDGHARLKIFQGSSVEVRPFLRRYSGIHRHGVIDDKIIGTQGSFEVGAVREPIPYHEDRQFVDVGDAKNALEHICATGEQPVLMRVKVRRTD